MAQAALAIVENAARYLRTKRTRAAAVLQQRAAEIRRENELRQREERRRAIVIQHQKAGRVVLALKTIDALCKIGSSHEFQELLKARRRPVTFWGGAETISPGYDIPARWTWTCKIVLTATAVELHCYTSTNGKIERWALDDSFVRVAIPYATRDSLLRTRPLWRIATAEAIDDDELDRHEEKDVNFWYSSEMLFHILTVYANPRRRLKRLAEAIR